MDRPKHSFESRNRHFSETKAVQESLTANAGNYLSSVVQDAQAEALLQFAAAGTQDTHEDTLRDTLRDTLQGYTSGHTAGHREDAPQDAPQDMLHSHPLLVMQVASSRDGRTGRARREAQSLLRWMW